MPIGMISKGRGLLVPLLTPFPEVTWNVECPAQASYKCLQSHSFSNFTVSGSPKVATTAVYHRWLSDTVKLELSFRPCRECAPQARGPSSGPIPTTTRRGHFFFRCVDPFARLSPDGTGGFTRRLPSKGGEHNRPSAKVAIAGADALGVQAPATDCRRATGSRRVVGAPARCHGGSKP